MKEIIFISLLIIGVLFVPRLLPIKQTPQDPIKIKLIVETCGDYPILTTQRHIVLPLPDRTLVVRVNDWE